MEVTLPMRRINVLKHQNNTQTNKQAQVQRQQHQPPQHPTQPQQQQPQSPQPHPEYSEKHIHKVIVTPAAGSDGTNIMQIKSEASNKIYTIHLEFTGDSTGMGEEIRETLKQKYLQQQLETGSLQTKPDALQSPSQKGEREGQGI